MNIENIHPHWGSRITNLSSPQEFFNIPADTWRGLLYDRKLLVFKNMQFTKEEYYKFCCSFGKPWDKFDYGYSKEKVDKFFIGNKEVALSPMSNLNTPRLGQKMMPWHADIPNKRINPFPHRSLWITKNPGPDSGLTIFLNIEEGLHRLTPELESAIPNIKIVQQSWYYENTELKYFDFVKKHPLTGNDSLRLNFFNVPETNLTDAWIKKVIVNGVEMDPKPILGPYLKHLSSQENLVYTHKWDTYDILIYDNWPLVHKRTRLEFDPTLERHFYRANVDHVSGDEWETHKEETGRL